MAELLGDLLSTGYTTPGGIINRKATEKKEKKADDRAERSLALEEKGLNLQTIPILLDYQKQQNQREGWGAARNLWRAHSGLTKEAPRVKSQSDLLIESIMSGMSGGAAPQSVPAVAEEATRQADMAQQNKKANVTKSATIGSVVGGPVGTLIGALIGRKK
jgi:hypothetical protein